MIVREVVQACSNAVAQAADEATRGVDQPVLSCLRFILTQGLQNNLVSRVTARSQ